MKCVQIRSFFWSVFSRIRTEFGEILHISLYSVRIREIRTRKNSVFEHFSRSESYNLRVLSQGYSHKFQGFCLCKNHKLFSTNTMIQFLAIHKSSLRAFWFFQRKYWPEMGKTELIWRWTTTTIITKTTKTKQNNKEVKEKFY